MKKLIHSVLALSMIFSAVSCQQENFEPVGEETTVSFTVSLPDAQTKTKSLMGEVSKVDELIYEVWKTEAADERDLTDKTKATRLYQKSVDLNKETQSTVITLNLVQDQEYTVLFWAQDKDADVYVTDSLTNVHYAKGWNGEPNRLFSNQENYEAYYAAEFVSDEDSKSRRVELKRPFAQLNLGTKNTQEEIDHEYGVRVVTSKVKISKVGTKFNVAQNYVDGNNSQIAVGGEDEVTFDTAVDPSGEFEKFTVNGQEYEYVAMNYLFATGNTATVYYEINTELTGTEGTVTEAQITNTVYEVPLQENFRTNIVGNLLTSTTEFNVVVNDDWNTPDLEPSELYLKAALGGEVTLTENVQLTTPLDVQADMKLNLNGNKLTGSVKVAKGVNFIVENGTIENTNKSVSAITSNGILTVNDVEIYSARHALRIESGSAVINGGIYQVVPISSSTLHAVNIGDNNTIADVVIKGGTFIGPSNTDADSGSAVTVKSGSSVKIEGGNFSGGKTKTLANSGTMIITGGNFDQKPADEWLSEGFNSVEKNGKWYVTPEGYNIAVSASDLKEELEKGGTVVLLNDIVIDSDNRLMDLSSGTAHLNLNGKKIVFESETAPDYYFIIRDGASLVIDGNGFIEVAPSSTLFYPGGNLVIENGTFIRNIPEGYTGNIGSMFTGTKPSGGWESTGVIINGGYFDSGYYDENAKDVEGILDGSIEFIETEADIAKRGVSGDPNKVRAALKNNCTKLFNRSNNYFKIYGGTFVGANPAWGDEGCRLPKSPNYLRPWSYYQGAFLDGQKDIEDAIVLPEGYTIEKGSTEDGRPMYTVSYNK